MDEPNDVEEPRSVALSAPRRVPAWFDYLARMSFGLLVIVGAVAVVVLTLGVLRELVIPFILAVFFAVAFFPATDWLAARRIPRSVGALIVILLIGVIVTVALGVVVYGLVDQADELKLRFDEAIDEIDDLAEQSDLADFFQQIRDRAEETATTGGAGIGARIGSFVDSATGFFSGLILGIVLLYYLLKDGREIAAWSFRSEDPDETQLYGRIADQAGDSIRGYFKGKTILAFVQAAFAFVAMALLGVPLAGSIAVVNFIGAYIPYIGAFIGGAFAVLMGLSEGGLSLALTALAVILVMNLLLENALEPKLLGSSLSLHPIVVLLSTVAGGVIAGLVGLILGAPITAICVRAYRELKRAGFFDDDDEPTETVELGE